MSFAITRTTGDGTTPTFTIGFNYRDEADLIVQVNGVTQTLDTHFKVTTGGTIIDFSQGSSPLGAPTNGHSIFISRATSQTTRLVDYAAGSVFKEADLDTDSTQGFFMAQEAIDIANGSITLDAQNRFDALNRRIINLADPVDDTDAVNKQFISTNLPNINTVAGIASDVTTVAGISTDVTAVAADAADIGTVSTNIASVNTTATNIANVNTVASDLNEPVSEIETVAGSIANVNTVGGDIANVNTVATDISNVNSVAGNATNINTVAGNNANVTTVAGISTDVTTVATNNANVTAVAGNATNINTVAGNSTNINTVAGISSDVTSVAADQADIGTVAADLGGSDTIGTVAGSISNVNSVGSNISNVNSVAGNSTNINAVAGNSTNINAVAGNVTNINAVAADATDIGTVATNIANVNTVAGDITNVNTVASNITSINSFANTYFISATAPASPTEGDLWFDTTNNAMKVYDGSSWLSVSPDLVGDTSPQLGGNLDLNSNDITGTGNVNITGSLTATDLTANGTTAIKVPVGTTAQRPTPAQGQLRFNSTDSSFEGYDGSAWGAIGGDAGGGATGGGSDAIFYENGQTVTTNYTITNGKNAMSAGPITINSGVTVTVGSGETWTVV